MFVIFLLYVTSSQQIIMDPKSIKANNFALKSLAVAAKVTCVSLSLMVLFSLQHCFVSILPHLTVLLDLLCPFLYYFT